MKPLYDMSHMPSFMHSLRCMQQKNRMEEYMKQQQDTKVEKIEVYDEMLDKFCYGSRNAADMKNVLSKL